jgi:hypothetical protein
MARSAQELRHINGYGQGCVEASWRKGALLLLLLTTSAAASSAAV